MVAANTIRRLSLEMEVKGGPEAEAALNRVTDAEKRVEDGANRLLTAMQAEGTGLASVGRAYDGLMRSVDAGYASQVKFERGQRIATQALEQGRISAAEYARTMDLVAAKHGMAASAVSNSITLERQQWEKQARAAREMQEAERRNASFNQFMGIREPLPTGGRTDRRRDLEAAFGTDDNGRARAAGLDAVTAALTRTHVANDNVAKSTGLARHEMINLGRQLQDVGTMAAMGASGMQILASQGAQVVDIFASSERGLGGWARAVGPTAGVVAAIAAALGTGAKAAWDYSAGQDAVTRSLTGVGRTSGATVAGINQAAEASAGAARISVATAREMGSAFAATGKIGVGLYGDLTVTAARYAKTAGLELPEATSKLASAFADPVKGATELNKTLGFLSGRTLELIERQSAMGDRMGAQRTINDAMKTSLLGLTEGTNGWATAWEKVSNAAKNAYDATGRALQRRFDPTLSEQIEDLRTRQDAPPRRGMSPYQIEAREKRLSLGGPVQDNMSELLERKMWADINASMGQREADTAAKTLKGKSIVEQMTPTNADILRLTEYRTVLQEALATGQASSGTADALGRVNKLLAQGGTEATQLRDAARDAFNVAGLLPFERGLAEIENRYKRLIEGAGGNKVVIAGLNAAKADERGAYNVQNSDVPTRDYRMRITEASEALRVQRESLYATGEGAATLAARQELVNEAFRNGQNPAQRYGGQLDALAASMGKVKAQEEEFNRVKANIVGGMDELRSGSRGLFTGIFSDARQGKSPLEGIKNSLGRMTDQIFDRTVSKPLVESMIGRDGQTGSGCIGDVISLTFGNDNAEPEEIAA